MSRRVTSPVIVGRDAELAELAAALDAAAAGAGGLFVVEGEAGIGKSRLIEEFVTSASANGVLVLTGACLPFADAVPYAPLAAILDHLSNDGHAAAGSTGVETADRFRLFRWVADELVKRATEQPVIVAVEDLQWADESTGDLLLFVANAARTAPVLVVASRRPAEVDHPTGLGAAIGELVRSGRAQRLTVGPLGRDDVGAMIGLILGVDPSPGLLDRVVSRSDGNPFFTEELVAAGGGDDLPTMVGDVILQRVARLDDATQRVLRVAAAIGRRVSHALLSGVAGIDPQALDAALRDAVGHQLLVATGDSYSFRHALGHETVYREILPGERAALHERIAVALSERPELALNGDDAVAAAELAHHWHAAGQLTKSLAASVAAARAAEVADAPIEAHVHYRRAIELWPRVDDAPTAAGVERMWLLEHAAETSSLAGSHHGAVQLVDQMIAEIDAEREPERHARILVRRALYLWYAGDATTSKQATSDLRELAEAGLTLAAVTRLCAVANQASLELRYLDALTLARDGMGAARQVAAQAEVGFALHILGSLESHLGSYDAAIDHLQQSLAISVECGDSQRVGSTWHNLAELYVYAGRPDEAVVVAERGIKELQRLGLSRTFAALTAGQLTFALLALGRWDEADRCSRDVIAGDAQPYFAVPVKLGRLHLLVRQGRFDEVEALLANLRTDFGGYDYMAGVCALWEAELAVWQHDWRRARLSLERAFAVTAATDEIGLELRLAALAVRLEADEYAWGRMTAAPRDRDAARAAADAHIRRAEAFLARITAVTDCSSLTFGRLLRLAYAERARLDDPADPAVWAGIASRAGNDVHLTAYARWREADTVLGSTARPDRAHAQALVRSAHEMAAALGAEPLCAVVADLAMRARIELEVTVPELSAEAADGEVTHGLTRRELEVLRLLGDGLSNREIGEALFISAKTASVHVTHILQKLNVTTRVQAALAADRFAGRTSADSP